METPALGDAPSCDTASLPSTACPDATKRRVTYYYEPKIGDFYYERSHPMKPLRIAMAHDLVVQYGLHRHMNVLKPYPARTIDLLQFHSDDYVDFLRYANPENAQYSKAYHVGNDECPVFQDMLDFSMISTGGSIGAAVHLNHRKADIAINWAGGLHHAHRSQASGFCYINDIVLGIMELLKYHNRVLYVDIDAHHGDGVEEAFRHSTSVMTVSFHKFGDDFFPGSGGIKQNIEDELECYALNVPLVDGIDDESFQGLFKPIILQVMAVYNPAAIVLQCGADSLSGDKIGPFNLTLKGHADCLRLMRSFNIPLMVLGGGGYNIGNVARCWCYETAVALGVELPDRLPNNNFPEFYGPDNKLHIKPNNRENKNSSTYLKEKRDLILQRLSMIEHAPSRQFQERPPDAQVPEEEEEEMDTRPQQVLHDDRCMGSYQSEITNEQTQMDEDTN